MLATSLIVFREVFEAALVVGIVMAAAKGAPGRGAWITAGVVMGLAAAGLVAVFARSIAAAAEGIGQELFNAAILFAAVFMLGWHNVWMSRHGRELARQMENVGRAVVGGGRPLYALAVVVGLAVVREGAETVLFLHGIAASPGSAASTMLIGGLLGVGAGIGVGLALYFGLLRIPPRHLFTVTAIMILFLAAGMAAQGAAFLVQADILPALGTSLWDSSGLLSERSLTGQILHSLFGYVARPAGIQLVFYAGTLLIIGTLMKIFGKSAPVRLATIAPAILALGLAATVLTALPAPAAAGTKVFSPIVDEGEVEIETRGSYEHDSDPSKNGKTKVKAGLGYGVTDWWFTELEGEWEREPGGNMVFEALEWENIFQLLPQGEYPVDAGFFVELGVPDASKTPVKVEFGPILRKEIGKTVHTVNMFFETKIGGGASSAVEFVYGWQSKWRLWRGFEPGFEAFGEVGDVAAVPGLSQQEHLIGPAAFGEIGLGGLPGKLQYEIGYLFGLTAASPDGVLKWLLEYEFRF